MAVGFTVGFYYYSIGSADFLHSFFSTVAVNLEDGKWGSRFPVLMNELYQVDVEVSIVYAFFFLVMALANYYMYRLIGKVDCSVMSIKEALVATTKVEDTRQKVKLLGWILGLPLIIIMFDVFKEMGHPEIIYGACVGLVIGGVVGYLVERKTRRLIRELRQTLADALADDDES